MKVCFLTPEYPIRTPFGGIATYVQVTAHWLTERGHQVHVICISRSGPWGSEQDAMVSVTFVPPIRIKPRRLLRYAGHLPGLEVLREAYFGWDRLEDSLGVWVALRKLVKDTDLDLIEIADQSGLGWWSLIWRVHHIPVLVRGHFLTDFDSAVMAWAGSRFQYWLEQQCARRADLVLTNSEHLARRYQAECQIPLERVHTLPMGFEIPHSRPNLSKQNVDLPQRPFILFVGWLDPVKGTDVLFQAMRLVHPQKPEVKLILVGAVTARFQSDFHAFMKEAKDWTQHLGTVSQYTIFSLMQRATVVVMPSRSESFGRVAVEAQLCGCPVVASRTGGLCEIVEDSVTGLLVQPGNPQILAEAILELVTRPDQAAAMGSRARIRARERYEITKVMQQQLEWYQTLRKKVKPRVSFTR